MLGAKLQPGRSVEGVAPSRQWGTGVVPRNFVLFFPIDEFWCSLKTKKLVSDSFCMDFEFLQKILEKIYWFLIGPKQSVGLLKLYFMCLF